MEHFLMGVGGIFVVILFIWLCDIGHACPQCRGRLTMKSAKEYQDQCGNDKMHYVVSCYNPLCKKETYFQ